MVELRGKHGLKEMFSVGKDKPVPVAGRIRANFLDRDELHGVRRVEKDIIVLIRLVKAQTYSR
jgi:hypothetical protein